MAGVNKVILIGRLGKDPEIRNFENGGMIANFSMATSETYKDRTTGEKKEITDWHNVVARIPQQAEIIQKYVKKGDMLYVEGKLRTRSWEKDGQTRYTTEVIIDNFTMLTPKGNSGGSAGNMNNTTSAEPSINMEAGTDDLPF
ncbi:MAG: single-stranded DNA-binding protein [Cyclobacteriaceae bacterium]|jgi:single-strand DNA-binding protein|nr:single-stranded DNA-binding protein [Flammeovirgaceae bacterium]MCZ8020862.1 single-stranded DNA-binding protein [Cytophagales bacterium]MCZ8328476.1 single-stranded DNA-binding protein [Cyclobacteriaceae bacterium]